MLSLIHPSVWLALIAARAYFWIRSDFFVCQDHFAFLMQSSFQACWFSAYPVMCGLVFMTLNFLELSFIHSSSLSRFIEKEIWSPRTSFLTKNNIFFLANRAAARELMTFRAFSLSVIEFSFPLKAIEIFTKERAQMSKCETILDWHNWQRR